MPRELMHQKNLAAPSGLKRTDSESERNLVAVRESDYEEFHLRKILDVQVVSPNRDADPAWISQIKLKRKILAYVPISENAPIEIQ